MNKSQWIKVFQNIEFWRDSIVESFNKLNINVTEIENTIPGTHAVFKVNKKYIIKIYWPKFEKDYFVENEILNILGNKRIPKKLYSGKTLVKNNEYNVLIETFIEGTPVKYYYENNKNIMNNNILKDLASTVKYIHNTDYSKLNSISIDNWKEFYINRKEEVFEQLDKYNFLSDNLKLYLKRKFEKLEFHEFKLINADLTEDHILIDLDDKEYRFKGLIDLADSKVAPIEYEWIALYYSGFNKNMKLFKEFLKYYDSSIEINSEFFDNLLNFTFLHQFGHEIIMDLFKDISFVFNTPNDLKDFLFHNYY